ncbi:hypothetical protein FJR11_08165 [Anabaena sp. UHCC 0187]|uniref:hypothetical protein n=1 Tax=Anabaena sp. UHCC 0187 TaxID=2590018 RepID=UPI00144725EE|nr:hypothetical protein [Anabaena sp. UHCC 0187]MDP5017406.1 hypothetical protein [Dolichospermum sp.]MTJ12568.1 hypothetical protein [Anabaena sp. UHCC 0187]
MKTIIILTTIISLGSVITLKSMPAIANPSQQHHQTNKRNKLEPVVIPNNQLPTPLTKGMVFREIASGGITGRTYQTVLLDDGRLLGVLIGDANDSQRSVKKVSPQQVKQFERLLNQTKFEKFNKLSFPAPQGSADYITYTLTSQTVTNQYNDISENQLPKELYRVVEAWNKLKNSAE